VPPKRRFLQEPRCVISSKIAFFSTVQIRIRLANCAKTSDSRNASKSILVIECKFAHRILYNE
jgi:hypothetical protein